jgi:hypothetical protein
MDRLDAVPVKPVPAPVNCVVAVIVVPVIAAGVVAPIVTLFMLDNVIGLILTVPVPVGLIST